MDLERFGITTGQMRGGELIHNGGWYDASGKKIGWGDMVGDDLRKIASELKEDEKFIVLGEQDSFWNFVRRPGIIGAMADVDTPSEQDPGMNYIREHARWIVIPGKIYCVRKYGGDLGEQKFNGLTFTAIRDSSPVLRGRSAGQEDAAESLD